MGLRNLTIDFLLILHQQERVIIDVAEKLDIRSIGNTMNRYNRLGRLCLLHPPVISILLKEFLSVKELRDVRHVR